MNAFIYSVIRIAEALFVFGCIGSALVLILSAIDDVHTVLEEEKTPGREEPEGGGTAA